MVGADADPPGVGGQVVDAVRDGLAQLLVHEVVHVDPLRLAARMPFPPTVLEVADQLLLLGVHADHRVAAADVVAGLVVEVAELGVAVGVLGALDVLALACRLNPSALSSLATVGTDTR